MNTKEQKGKKAIPFPEKAKKAPKKPVAPISNPAKPTKKGGC